MNIQKLKRKPLSNKDLYRLFENKVKIMTYRDLLKYDTIEEVLRPFNICFLLFETSENFGHWCVICYDPDINTVYFFDPYGNKPDEQFEFMKKNRRIFPYLSHLLIQTKKKLKYSKYKLQDIKDKNSATCGRWCALFAFCFNLMPLEEFGEIFQGVPDTESLITMLTHYA